MHCIQQLTQCTACSQLKSRRWRFPTQTASNDSGAIISDLNFPFFDCWQQHCPQHFSAPSGTARPSPSGRSRRTTAHGQRWPDTARRHKQLPAINSKKNKDTKCPPRKPPAAKFRQTKCGKNGKSCQTGYPSRPSSFGKQNHVNVTTA